MSSRPTGEASRLTSALTGASVALGIAREATDAVPIVKQVLGAALRIVGLAEKMDNDREALRALGASSLQLARQVTAVMAGKTPNGGIQASLERILKALDAIEKFMEEHAARNRLRRFVSYAFTVPQHVKRLSGELADAVRDLIVVALLDVDQQVQATHTVVEDNARFQGEFRLLRHCEVEKLDHLFDRKCWNEENGVFRYHRASVDGKLLVVRYLEGSIPPQSPPVKAHEETFKTIAAHDAILEEISTVQRSHPNVARIYGWSRGSGRERFTVFKSGFQPVYSVIPKCPDPVTTAINWALKLLVEMNCSRSSSPLTQDAVHHLQLMGIHWSPREPPYALDDQLQPIIGLQTDLSRRDLHVDQVDDAYGQLFHLTLPLRRCRGWQSVPAAKIQKLLAGCLDEQLADRLSQLDTIRRRRYIFPKEEFSDCRILTDAAAKRLLRIVEHEVFDDTWHDQSWMWANILLGLDKNRSPPLMCRLRCRLRLLYATYKGQADLIYPHGIDDDSERIVHDMYTFDVPHEQQDEVREMFAVSVPSEELYTSHVIATGTYCRLLD